MNQFKPQSRIDALCRAFCNEPYVPATSWTTIREFTLDPVYQHTARQYVEDPRFEKQQHEFVLDTSLVPPPGNDPGSTDFQSGA